MADTDYDPSELSPDPWPVVGPAVKRFFTPPTPPPKDEPKKQSDTLEDTHGLVSGAITGYLGSVNAQSPGLWKNNPSQGFPEPPVPDGVSPQAPAGFKDPTINASNVATEPSGEVFPNPKVAAAADPSETMPPKQVTPTREGQVGGRNIGSVPLSGETGVNPADKDESEDIFGNSTLGRALSSGFRQFNNWRNENKMQLMAMAGGLAGPRSGIGRAFSAGAEVMPQQQALNNQNATMNFLMSPKGGSMDANLARAVSGNSAMTQEVLGQLTGYAAPKTIITKDLTGAEHVQALQLNRQTHQWEINPIGGSGTSGGSTGASAGDNWDNLSIDQRLQLVAQQQGPEAASAIQAMAEGRAIPSARQQGLMPLATRVYGEQFDQQKANARAQAYRYWYGGGDGMKAMRALDQVSQHFGDLPAAVEAQGNWGGVGTGLNAPANYLAENFMGSTTQGPVRTVANAVTHELSGFWKPGHGSDADINKWAQDFPVNGSIPQQKKQVSTLIDLIEGGASANEDIRQGSMGSAADRMRPVMTPETRNRIDALKEWANDPNAKWGDVAAKHNLPNAGRAAAPAAAGGPAPPAQNTPPIPPPQQRQLGQIYNIPGRGPMRWMRDPQTGQMGWGPA